MKKIKINIDRAQVSKEEIESKRNFEQVLQQVLGYSKPFYQTNLFLNSILVILFATAVGYTVVKLNEQVAKEKAQDTVAITEVSATEEIASAGMKIGSIDSLQTQEFIVQINKDAVLKTAAGAVVKIPAGTLQAADTNVVLVVKEAYTMEDMIRAGLTTKTGNELLSSGGMFYIQAKDSAHVKITKPLAIDIPTAEVDADMKLFTGQKTASGRIDWQNPTELKKETSKAISEGEQLFKANCKSCHTLGKESVGPDLAYIGQRRDFDWIVRYVQNSSKMIDAACGERKEARNINGRYGAYAIFSADTMAAKAENRYAVDYSNDAYAICLYNAYNKSVMPSFPTLSKKEISAMCDYFNDESKRLKLPYPKDEAYINFQKCKTYKTLMADLTAKKNALKNKRSGMDQIEYKVFSGKINRSAQILQLPGNAANLNRDARKALISTSYGRTEYYQVEIKSFGWFNIDRLTKNMPGLVASKLVVNVPAAFMHTFQIYLVLPEMKVHAGGGLLKGSNEEYGFYEDDGNIMLPQGKTAHVYLAGEKDGKLIYAAATFVTDKVNKLSLNPAVILNETFNIKIKELINTEGISIKASDSKNAAALREMDAAIIMLDQKIEETEKMKPANCDCNCEKAEPVNSIEEEYDFELPSMVSPKQDFKLK